MNNNDLSLDPPVTPPRSLERPSMRLLSLSLTLLLALLLASCAAPTPPPTPAPTESLALAPYFHGYTGAFVLYDLNTGQAARYNPQRCAERLLPASTFKILNALIALETGVIPGENYVIKWDSTRYPTAAWNQDHTLRTAMQNSVVWYFQELARRAGPEKMQQYIGEVGYGNRDISGSIDSFWLDGALRISADEQVEFLRRLVRGDLPFSKHSMQVVRDILTLEKTSDYTLSGKTGSGQVGDQNIGWFVGYLESSDNVYFFAANITGTGPDAQAGKAKEITLQILRDRQLLP